MTLRDFFNSLIDTPISEFFIFIVIFGLGIVFFNFCTETLEKYLKNETWTHLILWFILFIFHRFNNNRNNEIFTMVNFIKTSTTNSTRSL